MERLTVQYIITVIYPIVAIILISLLVFFIIQLFSISTLFKPPVHEYPLELENDLGWGKITEMKITDNARTGDIGTGDQVVLSVTYQNTRNDIISVNSMVHLQYGKQIYFKTEDTLNPSNNFVIYPQRTQTVQYSLITGLEGGNVINLILNTNETNAPAATHEELIRNFDVLSIQDIILKESNKNNRDAANIAAIIGGITAIALIVQGIILAINRNDQKQLGKLNALSEIFIRLNTDEHRLARRQVYTAYDDYKTSKNPDIFDRKPFYDAVNMVQADFDQIGLLIKNKLVPLDAFMDIHADTVILCWKSLEIHITRQRESRNYPEYMKNFQDLFNLAKKYWEKRFKGRQLPEPSKFDRIHT